MSSTKYGKDFAVPKDFPSVLKAFTREVLRSQPDNIYEFGAQYFSEILAQLDEMQEQSTSSMQRLSPAQLEEIMRGLFNEFDVDRSGSLELDEFKVHARPAPERAPPLPPAPCSPCQQLTRVRATCRPSSRSSTSGCRPTR